MALGDLDPRKFHRKHGKLYGGLKKLAFNEDLIVDENGVPDATQNPDAFFIGATDAGYDFKATPNIVLEEVDEAQAALSTQVDSWDATISFKALQVLDLELFSKLQPGTTYSENTVAGVTTRRISAGGSAVDLDPLPVAVISKEKNGGFVGAMLHLAYNSGDYSLQFKKTERSGQDMVIKGLADESRDDDDQIWRSFVIEAALTISTASPLTGGVEDVAYSETLEVSGGIAPYTWTVSSGTLPAGLTLSSGGVLSGTPTTAGSSTFTVQATDDNGATQTKSLTLVINAAP
jgi:hypothetical protein